MKNDLRSILYKIDSIEQIGTNKSTIHVGVKLLVTILFLFCMLSCKLEHIGQLLLYFIYPILGSALASVSYWHLFKNSLFVLPFVLFIGILLYGITHQILRNTLLWILISIIFLSIEQKKLNNER